MRRAHPVGPYNEQMSEQSSERDDQRDQRDETDGPMSVPDEDLPEDLRPAEDNPLAQPADDDVPEDVLKDTAGGAGGQPADSDSSADSDSTADSDTTTDSDEDSDGSDEATRDGDDET